MYLLDHQHLRMNYLQPEKQVVAQVRSECKERNPQIFNFLFKFSINPPSISLTLHGSIWKHLSYYPRQHALRKLLIWLKWHLTRFMFWTNKLKRITRIKWKKNSCHTSVLYVQSSENIWFPSGRKMLIWLELHLTRFLFWTNKLKRATRIKLKQMHAIQVYSICNLLKMFGFLPLPFC